MDKYNLGTVGSGIVVTELFSGSVGNVKGSGADRITLNDNITNYKFLVFDFYVGFNGGEGTRYYSKVISVQQFINLFNNPKSDTNISFCWGYSNVDDYFDILQGSTTMVLKIIFNRTQCLRIVGIN